MVQALPCWWTEAEDCPEGDLEAALQGWTPPCFALGERGAAYPALLQLSTV